MPVPTMQRNQLLGLWKGCRDFPKDMSNLAKLCHFYTPRIELHSEISNVGKLKLLEELKVFRVNKESEGFETKQLEHLTELRKLGIYNLEKIHTKEEASEAKLIEKKYLERLTLDWDSKRANVDPGVEALVLESLQPHRYLQKLSIRGHMGSFCPKWLGDELDVKALQSRCLSGVSWKDFPPLGKMFDLREVTLECIATMKEFVIEQSFCRLTKLTLSGLNSFEKWVPSQDANHLFPALQVLLIRDCPKLSVLPFSNQVVCPPDQDRNMDWFPKLQKLGIVNCPNFFLVARIPWTETLNQVNMRDVKLLEKFQYSKSSHGIRLSISGKDDLHSIDQVLASDILTEVTDLTLEKGPCLELRHLVMLTSLNIVTFRNYRSHVFAPRSSSLVETSGGHGDVKRNLPALENLRVMSCGASGKELTELLTHLPRLSDLSIWDCEKITQLAVGVDLQQTTSAAVSGREDGGLLLLPGHLSDSLRDLMIRNNPELVLVDPPSLLPGGGGGLQALRFLQEIAIWGCPKFLSACLVSSPSRSLFPSSLQSLELQGVKGMGTLELLSNLTSLTSLDLTNCGEDLRCEGLGPLLGQLRELTVFSSPKFFAGWNPNARRVLQHEGGGEEQRRQIVSPLPTSSKLQLLYTDEAEGLLAAPICSLLSSSLAELRLWGTKDAHLESFSNDGLHLLTSLQELEFNCFDELQHLPAGLHKLPNLKRLEVDRCPALRSLPDEGLPKSLKHLDVRRCGNEELIQQCRGLVGTIPEIVLED
ncbi:hypothetical protein BRADI_1g00284v3 [Brachypodium distachyon]|uniref:R13L1/DRL21-like LRR repeat region domain-containing protein n=1 Tax=Brachypodium distachyon TaxID=15368 RepID=A0A0Q3GLC0_BRADI|nr:hypothetical protein BRADI_1g00284v3 [Brachypodium distachyon]